MRQNPEFQDILRAYVRRFGFTPGQLSQLSGLPKATIINWLEGRVRKPRQRDDLLKLAATLRLDTREVRELLQAAGYPYMLELPPSHEVSEDGVSVAGWGARSSQAVGEAPFQAIGDLPYFVGRRKQLLDVEQELQNRAGSRVVTVQGMAGIGKTAFAARIAYEVRPYFPDGVLWARVATTDTMSILSAFANAYGRDVSTYQDTNSRSQVVREVLAHKRTLIVLDNVEDSAQIEPLLPPTGNCAVLITTRKRNLRAALGGYQFELPPFDPSDDEALQLFEKILGWKRARNEQVPLREIADLLGHMPLAIVIAACRLAYELDYSADKFLGTLRQEHLELKELEYENWSVRLSFELTYDRLNAEVQTFLSGLGTEGGIDFDLEAVAFINKVSVETARAHLSSLYDLSLVQRGKPGRYRLHPLLRSFAQEKITDRHLYERLAEYYVAYAEKHAHDYAALEHSSENIFAALEVARDQSLSRLFARGVLAIYLFLETKGLYARAEEYLQTALSVSSALEDDQLTTNILLDLGRVKVRKGEYALGQAFLEEALELARRSGDTKQICDVLTQLSELEVSRNDANSLAGYSQEAMQLARSMNYAENICKLLIHFAIVARKRGDYTQAIEYHLESLELASTTGDSILMSQLFVNLGGLVAKTGDYTLSEAYLRKALALAQESGRIESMISVLGNLGVLAGEQDQFERSASYLREGLELARKIEHRERISLFLWNLAILANAQGNSEAALEYLREALELAEALDNMWLTGALIGVRAESYLKGSDLERARADYTRAYDIAQKTGSIEYAAAALYGLAQAAAMGGRTYEVTELGQKSINLYASVNHPAAARVADWLETQT